MLAVRGVFDGKAVQLLEKIPFGHKAQVVVTFLDEPKPEADTIREMTANPDGFGFWEKDEEDLYQDYLKTNPSLNRVTSFSSHFRLPN